MKVFSISPLDRVQKCIMDHPVSKKQWSYDTTNSIGYGKPRDPTKPARLTWVFHPGGNSGIIQQNPGNLDLFNMRFISINKLMVDETFTVDELDKLNNFLDMLVQFDI